eukprot:GFUD01030235.1.p1 GENE.GFUD01030235.1~~GFUD01030235.1.p1  ORF type:complete len:460 (-),score=94.61 GFUD01030235.1:117-1496(-)
MKLSTLSILLTSALLLASLEAGRGSQGKSTSGSSHGRSIHSLNAPSRLSSRGSGPRKSTWSDGIGSKRNSGTSTQLPAKNKTPDQMSLNKNVHKKFDDVTTAGRSENDKNLFRPKLKSSASGPENTASRIKNSLRSFLENNKKTSTMDKSSIAVALGNFLSNKKVDKTGPRTICKRSTGECTNTENTDSKTKNALRSILENSKILKVSTPELKNSKKTETGKSSLALALGNFLLNKKDDKLGTRKKPKARIICKRNDGGCHKMENKIIKLLKTEDIAKYEEAERKYKELVDDIHLEKDKYLKGLKRDALAKELLHDRHELAKNYNNNIEPIRDQKLEFSQDAANFKFRGEFKHQGKTIQEVAKSASFDTNDFVIHLFPHPDPTKPDTLVADNNRGLAAHAIAGQDVGRYRIIKPENAANYNAFLRREGDGQTIKYDKNIDKNLRETKLKDTKISRTQTY